MAKNNKFDSKTFLRNTYNVKIAQGAELNSILLASSTGASNQGYQSRIMGQINKLFIWALKPIIKPIAIRLRSFFVYQIAAEINYAQSQQNRINDEILDELRKIRDVLENKTKK